MGKKTESITELETTTNYVNTNEDIAESRQPHVDPSSSTSTSLVEFDPFNSKKESMTPTTPTQKPKFSYKNNNKQRTTYTYSSSTNNSQGEEESSSSSASDDEEDKQKFQTVGQISIHVLILGLSPGVRFKLFDAWPPGLKTPVRAWWL